MNTCIVVRHLSPGDETVEHNGGAVLHDDDPDSGVPVAKRPCRKLLLHWVDGRDKWWHEEMADALDECEPEWMEAEDPLFMLYTR